MKPILEIQHISKKFSINHEHQPYLSIRDSISGMFKPKDIKEDFWALNDVDFNVEQGDTVGIIGKNGAGKSTLLKILSKITPPTSGKIIGRGRIASLLEVGTGFHPELTGRENVFMNGSILGMKKTEILKNFDAIVDFAGVSKFIDTPLKHYSSGMQLRLAFAVAAFLENEILIIDEVLAVGDAEFQKKCLGKMGEVSKSGRTILFVSHQLGVIGQLCKKGVFLKNGSVKYVGKAEETINFYLQDSKNADNNIFINTRNNLNKDICFEKIWTCDDLGNYKEEFAFDESINLRFNIKNSKSEKVKIGMAMLDKYGNRIFSNYYEINNAGKIKVELPKDLFAPNHYSFLFALLKNDEVLFVKEDVCSLKIIDTGSEYARYEGFDYGYIIAKCNWATL